MPLFLAPPVGIVQQAPPATERLRVDIKGRPMIAVTIDGKGPVEMIVDTGAVSTVMRAEAARTLALTPTGQTVQVSGVAASGAASTYRVTRLASALFAVADTTLPALDTIGTTQASGIIGMDLFAQRKLVFDRALQEVRVAPSGPAPTGFETVAGTVEGDGLYIPLTINGVAVDGLIDSGAEGTVMGPDVLRAMGWKDDDPRVTPFGQLGGAGGGGAQAGAATMDAVTVGPVTLNRVSVVINPTMAQPPGAGTKPRIILGLNVLNQLQAYAVDLPRAEFQFRRMATADQARAP